MNRIHQDQQSLHGDNSQSTLPPQSVMPSQHGKVAKQPASKRILLTGINSLVGHSLFEQMRNDHIMINAEPKCKPHKFLATIIGKHEATVPVPSPHAITVIDVNKKPKTFAKGVLTSDIVVVDLLSGTDLEEAELIIKLLRQPANEALYPAKQQTLILISTALVWSKTPGADSTQYKDSDFLKRTPTPKFQHLKNLENLAMSAAKSNKCLRVHIVCSGMPYGNGESNEVFYEFFRRAWLSLHPDLAALPVIGKGCNYLPTIHVSDLARCVRLLVEETPGQKFCPPQKQYLVAVDQCQDSSQRAIMQAISQGLGSGAVSEVELCDVLAEDWAEFMTVDLRLKLSDEFAALVDSDFHCPQGICKTSLPLLNEEFNMFRGLFPLKVFIGGPPAVGKSHFSAKLASSYGIPHLHIAEMIEHAKKEKSALGDRVRANLEQLKDHIIEEFEKTRKKKDNDLNRDELKPRLGDDMVFQIIKARIESPACMNKGFILDGYPRNRNNARSVFYDAVAGYEAPEEGEDEAEVWANPKEPKGRQLNTKVLPQYAIMLDGEDAFLKSRIKDLPADKPQQANWADKEMDRRLKTNKENNQGENQILGFFQAVIDPENCMCIEGPEALEDENKVLESMKIMTEKNGKPCCLNLITEADTKFLKKLQKDEETRTKLSQEESKQDLAESSKGEDDDLTSEQRAELAKKKEAEDSESEDEVGALIRREEEDHLRNEQEAEERRRCEAEEAESRRIRETKEATRLEEIRQQERDLLDQRSQPIRQYLMDNVVPHLTEGLIQLCKEVPEDSTEFLANFLFERADLLDEQVLREREEMLRKKQEEKKQQARKANNR